MAKDETILEEAKERYKISSDAWSHIYSAAKDDINFVYDVGDGQWPADVRQARGKRPIVTVNKLQKFVRQLRGDQGQNRPRIKVIPVDSVSDPQMAELYNGIIRKIEYQSSAEIAYDTSYGHAISSSIGFFRIISKFEDSSFDQDLYIKRILNNLSVHFDPAAVEFNFEDASFCFIEDSMRLNDFKRKYRGASVVDFEGLGSIMNDWFHDERVRVAEYFWKEPIKKTLVQLSTGEIIELNKKITVKKIKDAGGEIVRDREFIDHKVMWCKMTGAEILEKSEWAGKNIPVIPVFGDEVVVDGKRYYLSLIRGAKGPQLMYNMWATAATENVGLSPKAPFIVDHRQIKGFESEWDVSNIKNSPYMRYNHIPGIEKPRREQQTQVPNAIIGMLQSTAFDIEDHLGRYEASKGQASNERSAVAIRERITQSDKGTFTFIDNLFRAIIYAGRQLIDLIPKIYDTERAFQIMDEAGNHKLVNVNQPAIGNDGEPKLTNDLSVGKFDLIATTGASSSSKRQEMVQMMIEAMQYAPDIAPIIAPLIFKYSDWPGAQEIHDEIKKGLEQQQLQLETSPSGATSPFGA